MAFVFNDNLALAKVLLTAGKNPSGKYSLGGEDVSYEALNATLIENMKELTHEDGKFDLYKAKSNENVLFSLISRALNAVMPRTVYDTYGTFADVQTVAQGDKIVFNKKVGQLRAKQFVTRVALAGRYEVFELGEEKFEIQTTAYGGAARIAIEEFLDGRVMLSDYMSVINEGMAEAVYKEIAKALVTAIARFPATNKVSAANFDESQFDRLIATVSVYGDPVIYCTKEAAMTLIPPAQRTSNNMLDEYWNNGYFTRYKGTPVVILPQSFTDETNATKVIDPSYIYIFPSMGSKPVQIVFEGDTLLKSWDNRDWSTEWQTYQKFGVGIITTNNLAVYRNTSLGVTNVPGTWA